MRQNGFTLMEIVIVVLMVGLGVLVLVSLFLGQNEIYKTQTAELNITGYARAALDDIDGYVRSADIVANSHGAYTTGSQTLVLQVPSINASSQIIAGTYDYVIYYLSSTNFLREIQPDAASSRGSGTKKLAANVTGLTFTYNNGTLSQVTQVTTDMTIQEAAGKTSRAITISSKSKLRNN